MVNMTGEDFHGLTVAVVGNSDKLLEQSNGRTIDQHDTVIRFNRAWPNRAKKYGSTGRKTTHMSLVVRNGYEAMIQRNEKVGFFLPMPPPVESVPQCCKGLPCIDANAIRDLKSEMQTGKRPSSGASVLWFLLNCTAATRITVFGMDGMISGKWYETKDHWHGHDKQKERDWFRMIAMNQRVEWVEV